MVFSSLVFLFLFLPTLHVTYFAFFKKIAWQNFILMLFSLSFYYWGEKDHIFIMMACIFIHYFCALLIEQSTDKKQRKIYLVTAIIASLALLIYFKYFNFLLNSIGAVFDLNLQGIKKISLPLGISFYTFHALSYVLDVYWHKVKAERNLVTFIGYVSFFPQLVAGPIVRYRDIHHAFKRRYITRAGLRNGIIRFCFGLAKKVLIANEVAKLADYAFYLPIHDLTWPLAWLGAIAYALQIYFDFSGYSDMAIGLGLMFGFRYHENFRFPYTALSIQEFWRKWHISLSSWFRDYVYIPLGGSRGSLWRTQINLIIVFILCGLWHGANLTFLIWGLFHGFFLTLERTAWGRWLAKAPKGLRHSYVLLVVLVGWVFFREDTLDLALQYLQVMCSPTRLFLYDYSALGPTTLCAMLFGIPLALGFCHSMTQVVIAKRNESLLAGFKHLNALASFGLLLASIVILSTNSYNPFLYFRF